MGVTSSPKHGFRDCFVVGRVAYLQTTAPQSSASTKASRKLQQCYLSEFKMTNVEGTQNQVESYI